jgi:hypothetical protein
MLSFTAVFVAVSRDQRLQKMPIKIFWSLARTAADAGRLLTQFRTEKGQPRIAHESDIQPRRCAGARRAVIVLNLIPADRLGA